MNVTSSIPCEKCGVLQIVDNSLFERYFKKDPISCAGCKLNIDWWATVQNAIRKNFMQFEAFSTLGANSKLIKIILKPNQRTSIKLSEHGISNDARILYINYTPQGGRLFPLEIHGNVPRRRILGDEIRLYPMPLGKTDEVGETEVGVMIVWVEHSLEEESLVNITNAFDSYSTGYYQDAVVPANVSVESSLAKLMTAFISKFVGKERVENFLTDAATYNSQLNVVLPLIVNLKDLTSMPDNIRGLLNKLRGLRNQIAHLGKTKEELSQNDLADLLSAALFGLRYIALIDHELREKP